MVILLLAADALDLSLLLEVSELYCSIILRKSGAHVFLNDAWPVSMASVMCPADVLHAFAATSGDALISIAERLVEDVVYVMGSAASPVPPSGGGGSSRGSRPAGASSSALSSSPANGSGSTAVPQGAGLGSSAPPAATSSNNSMKQPWYGHANPAVTLEHRLAWAQAAVATLGTVSGRRQPASWQQGHEGEEPTAQTLWSCIRVNVHHLLGPLQGERVAAIPAVCHYAGCQSKG
jgi:hypothetical protein